MSKLEQIGLKYDMNDENACNDAGENRDSSQQFGETFDFDNKVKNDDEQDKMSDFSVKKLESDSEDDVSVEITPFNTQEIFQENKEDFIKSLPNLKNDEPEPIPEKPKLILNTCFMSREEEDHLVKTQAKIIEERKSSSSDNKENWMNHF